MGRGIKCIRRRNKAFRRGEMMNYQESTNYACEKRRQEADLKGASLIDHLGNGDLLIVRKSEEYKIN